MLREFLWIGRFLPGTGGDGDRDKVGERDFSFVTDLRLRGDLETRPLSLDLDDIRLLGDLETLFCPLSLDLDVLLLRGDLETLFCPLSFDLDGHRLRDEDLCL